MQIKHPQEQSSAAINPLLKSDRQGIPRELHKYIWSVVGVLGLFVASFPIAYFRVANSEKFDRQPFKSITPSENQKDNLIYPEKK